MLILIRSMSLRPLRRILRKERKVELLEAELKAAGRECAYILDAQESFERYVICQFDMRISVSIPSNDEISPGDCWRV